MRSAIAVKGSFFNTQRMAAQYLLNAYLPQDEREKKPAPEQTAVPDKAQRIPLSRLQRRS
jgi:hypothetical protein